MWLAIEYILLPSPDSKSVDYPEDLNARDMPLDPYSRTDRHLAGPIFGMSYSSWDAANKHLLEKDDVHEDCSQCGSLSHV
jgi:hypothetical protein